MNYLRICLSCAPNNMSMGKNVAARLMSVYASKENTEAYLIKAVLGCCHSRLMISPIVLSALYISHTGDEMFNSAVQTDSYE